MYMENNAAPAKNEAPQDKMTPAKWLLRLLQGAIIGAGAVLPGISGGVLCVVFGIYQPMMELLAHPFRMFKKYYQMFIPILLGVAAGFLLLARLLSLLFNANETIMICIFIGLIVGTLPSLYRETGQKGHPKSAWIAFAIAFIVLYALLMFLKLGGQLDITPNIWWYFFCGIIFGISIIVPGMSFSSPLMALNLYEPMIDSITAFSLEAIIPIGIGTVLVIVALSRAVNYLFDRHYAIASHIILAAVLATTFSIIPYQFSSAGHFIICLVCAVAGFFAAWGLDKISNKYLSSNK